MWTLNFSPGRQNNDLTIKKKIGTLKWRGLEGGKKPGDLRLRRVVFLFFVFFFSRKSVQVGGAPVQDEATQLMTMTQAFGLLRAPGHMILSRYEAPRVDPRTRVSLHVPPDVHQL